MRITKIHYFFIAVLAGQVILYDAWQLITPEAVNMRWTAVGALFVLTTIVWYMASGREEARARLHSLVWALVVADILLASYYVYLHRGVAAKAVALYAIPIIISAVLMSRRAIIAASALSLAAYAIAVQAYATLNFNEGYKIERYGEIFFYAGVVLVLAGLLSVLVHTRRKL
jgi:hypothetical protein